MGRSKGGGSGEAAIQAGQDRAIQALERGKQQGLGFLDTAEQQGLEGVNLVIPQSRRIMQDSFNNLENFDELANQQAETYDKAYLQPSQRAIEEQLKNLFRSGGVGGSNNSRLQNFMARNAEETAFNEAGRRVDLRNKARKDFLDENTSLYNVGSQPEMYRSGNIIDLGKTRANTAIGAGSQQAGVYQQSAGQLASAQQQAQQRRDSKSSGMATLGAGVLGAGLKAATSFSDERLKENIEPVGELDNGLTVYAYNFKGSPKTEIGLIAQEVAQVKPQAVHKDKSGYLKVHYKEAVAA